MRRNLTRQNISESVYTKVAQTNVLKCKKLEDDPTILHKDSKIAQDLT